MLKADITAKLKAWGLDVDKLVEAIKADTEQDFTLPEVTVMSATDLEARDLNTKAEGKREGVAEGKKAGFEIASKTIAKKFNIAETVDAKKLEDVLEAVSTSVTGGDVELKKQIELLQKDKDAAIAERDATISEKKALAFDTELITNFPANRTADLSDSERLMLLKNVMQFEEVDGVRVAKRNGEVLRDPVTKSPLPYKEAITSIFNERKWIAEAQGGGRGGNDNPGAGGNSGGAGIRKFSDAQSQWLKDNPSGNTISPEFTTYVTELSKGATDFDFYN